MTALLDYALTLTHVLRLGIRQRIDRRESAPDAGIGTLEMVIIALGLMAIAGLLVAALTGAVTRRTNQIR